MPPDGRRKDAKTWYMVERKIFARGPRD